jgi:hypothetical protein
MPTINARKDYLSYMLRLWRSGSPCQQRGAGWRASLESSHTQERFAFAGLTELFTFLEQEIEQADEPEGSTPSSG